MKKNYSGYHIRVNLVGGTSYEGICKIDSRDTIGQASESDYSGIDLLIQPATPPVVTRVYIPLSAIESVDEF